MKPIQKIALISPNPRFPDFEKRFYMTENALPLIGTVLKQAGYEVEVFMERIAPIPWERVLQADLVGFSAVTCSVNCVYEMVQRIKGRRNIPVVLGGPHASMLPDDAIQHVDYVVREEGEETILELLTMLNNGGDLKGVKGISYIKNGVPYHNPSRELLKNFDIIPDLSLVCGYQQLNPIKLFLQAKAHAHFLETSRGCPYPCKFCWRIGMKTMRHRSPEAVAEDLRSKTSFFPGFPNWLIILDSYFGVNRERTKAVLKEIIKSGVKSHSLVFARYEVAEDLEMLDLMKRAGVTWLFMGVESVDNKTLDDYDKKQTIEKVEDSIQRIRRYGIQVCAGFVLGSDNDTKDTVKQTLEWTQKSGAGWMMMNVLTEFPEGPERVISSDRIFQKNWDYYNLQFITHFPKNIKPSELQQGIYDAYRSFYSWRSILTNLFKGQIVVSFYQWFRRLMMKSFLQEMQAYIPYLKQVEEGRYDASGRFVEEREMELPRVA